MKGRNRNVCARMVRGGFAAVKKSSMMSDSMGATVDIPMKVESLRIQNNLR